MKYLIILPEGEARKRNIFAIDCDYGVIFEDEDYDEITDAIESVTDKPKSQKEDEN